MANKGIQKATEDGGLLDKMGVDKSLRDTAGQFVDENSGVANAMFDQAQGKVLSQTQQVVPKKLASVRQLNKKLKKIGNAALKGAKAAAASTVNVAKEEFAGEKEKAMAKVEAKGNEIKVAAEDAAADIAAQAASAATEAAVEAAETAAEQA